MQGFDPTRSPAVAVGKWLISTAGGDKPRWARNGKELYYLAPDRKMMAVPVKIGPTFEPGVAIPLFDTRAVGFFPYDVSADGRFLVNTVSDVAASASSPVTKPIRRRATPRICPRPACWCDSFTSAPISLDSIQVVVLLFRQEEDQFAVRAERHGIAAASDLARSRSPVERRQPDLRFSSPAVAVNATSFPSGEMS